MKRIQRGTLMAEAYIVDAMRTAGGRRGGKLAGWHPADLGGAVLDALVGRTDVDPGRSQFLLRRALGLARVSSPENA